MTPRQVVDIDRAPPGDRGPILRSLAARYAAIIDSVIANGPNSTTGRQGARTRAERSLRKVWSMARRYGVCLGREDMETASECLAETQRAALRGALADPRLCAMLANTALEHAQNRSTTASSVRG